MIKYKTKSAHPKMSAMTIASMESVTHTVPAIFVSPHVLLLFIRGIEIRHNSTRPAETAPNCCVDPMRKTTLVHIAHSFAPLLTRQDCLHSPLIERAIRGSCYLFSNAAKMSSISALTLALCLRTMSGV